MIVFQQNLSIFDKRIGKFWIFYLFSSVNLTNVAEVLEKFANLIQQNWKRKRKRTLVH